jgi:hippurate hydrolase
MPHASRVIDDVTQDAAMMTEVRHQLHAHPELGFAEMRTAETVATLLRGWGYEVACEIGGTGVVASLVRGRGRRIGLRAELDAQPLREIGTLPYASVNFWATHAAGHDGDMAMLLAAGRYLARAGTFSGTVRLIFQPASEGLGGAARMLEDGLLERFPCDALFASRNAPEQPAGTLATRSGLMAAGGDWFDVSIASAGSAASCGSVDATVVAAAIVMALQSNIVQRLDPPDCATLHVSSIQAGASSGISADLARLMIVVRSLGETCRQQVLGALHDLLHRQAKGFGAQLEITPSFSQPQLVNTLAETRLVIDVAQEVLGESNVISPRIVRPLMRCDDFGLLLQNLPGCYFMLGTQARTPMRLYHPGYDFNDACLQPGSALLASLAERFLSFGRRDLMI